MENARFEIDAVIGEDGQARSESATSFVFVASRPSAVA
jgi:hypothetical protein